MSDKKRGLQANGNWFTVIAPNSENTVGLVFFYTLTVLMFFALLRAWGRERRLLATIAASAQEQATASSED